MYITWWKHLYTNIERKKKVRHRAAWERNEDDVITDDEFDEDAFLKGRIPVLRQSVDRELPPRPPGGYSKHHLLFLTDSYTPLHNSDNHSLSCSSDISTVISHVYSHRWIWFKLIMYCKHFLIYLIWMKSTL